MAWFVDTIVWKSWFGLVRVEKRNVRKVLIYLLREIQYAPIVGYLLYLIYRYIRSFIQRYNTLTLSFPKRQQVLVLMVIITFVK